jgi:hypothetical protein
MTVGGNILVGVAVVGNNLVSRRWWQHFGVSGRFWQVWWGAVCGNFLVGVAVGGNFWWEWPFVATFWWECPLMASLV